MIDDDDNSPGIPGELVVIFGIGLVFGLFATIRGAIFVGFSIRAFCGFAALPHFRRMHSLKTAPNRTLVFCLQRVRGSHSLSEKYALGLSQSLLFGVYYWRSTETL